MAFGQIQSLTAPPQPGTSNLPYPVGKAPAFVPVTLVVTDTYGIMVLAHTSAIISLLGTAETPGTVLSILAEINSNLARIADNRKALASALDNLNIAIGTKTTALTMNTSVLASMCANQVVSNNLYKATSGETPVLPSLEIQIKTAVADGITLSSQAKVAGFITGKLNGMLSTVSLWITGTDTYQTVASWATKISNYVLLFFPPSAESLASRVKTGKIT